MKLDPELEKSGMKNSGNLAEALTKAIRERDLEKLLIINRLSFQEKCDLREALKIETLAPEDREQLIEWAWHDNPSIEEAVRALILLFGSDLTAACFERFSNSSYLSAPFELEYNTSEREFHVDLPHVPGFCVCHYGRDDKRIDRILFVLERAYQKMHPESKISGFRS